jgi:hypothetical protein
VNQQSIVMAADQNGQSCAFFLDPVKGPYVVGGSNGLKWCGKDVVDWWEQVPATLRSACWGVWHPLRNQVIFAFSTGAATSDCNRMLVLDVTEMHEDEDGDLRGGWVVYNGRFTQSRCGVMFSNTLASPRSAARVPYVGNVDGDGLGRYDESAQSDFSTPFGVSVLSGAISTGTHSMQVDRTFVIGVVDVLGNASLTLKQSLGTNGDTVSPRDTTVVLTYSGGIPLLKKFEDAAAQDAWTLQVELADQTLTQPFSLLRWYADITVGASF